MSKEMPPYKKDSLPEKVDLRKYMSEVEDRTKAKTLKPYTLNLKP